MSGHPEKPQEAQPASLTALLNYFGGYADKEVVEALGVALATVRRDWEFARSWLFDRMRGKTGVGGLGVRG